MEIQIEESKTKRVFKTANERMAERQFFLRDGLQPVMTDGNLGVDIFIMDKPGQYYLLAFSHTRGKPDIQCIYKTKGERAARIKEYLSKHKELAADRPAVIELTRHRQEMAALEARIQQLESMVGNQQAMND